MSIKWNPCIIIEGEILWEEMPFMLPEEKMVVLLKWNCPCYFPIHFPFYVDYEVSSFSLNDVLW